MNYYISDLHFEHNNIIKFCDRPWNNVIDMNEALISNWNARVNKDDHVYILGDICMSVSGFINYVERLNGTKHIILGNHDPKNIQKRPIKNTIFHELIHSVREGDLKVVLCHYPIHEWNGYYHGVYHFYGHVHGTRISHHERAFEVCCDVINYEPKTFAEIIAMEKPTAKLNNSPPIHVPDMSENVA